MPLKLQEHLIKCRDDFKSFVDDIFLGEKEKNQPFHDELDDLISQDFTSDDPLQKFFSVITMPRDHGKSKHLSVAYPLWKIAKNHDLKILAISRAAGITEAFLSEIVSNVERNDKYKEWAKFIDPEGNGVIPRTKLGQKRSDDWSGSSITIERETHSKDPTICATGLFGQILSRRADIVILDDVVDQSNSMTELQRRKVIDWIETTVIPVLVPGGVLIYLGNTWHTEDVVSKFMVDPRFQVTKRLGAIVHEADRQDLWQQWASIMLNITIQPRLRKAAADDFYNKNKIEMDKGAETLWPSRYPYSNLYFMRLLNPYMFSRMYQCDPSNRPDQVIKDEWIDKALAKGRKLRFQDMPHPLNHVEVSAGGMDLAISQEEAADDTALVYLDVIRHGYDGVEDGDYLIRQIHRGHFTPNEQRQVAKTGWASHGLQTIRVESVGYQKSLVIDLANDSVPVRAYNTGSEKFDPEIGINSFAVVMELGKVVIPSDPTDARTIELASKLSNEMRAFPDGHTGDSLMALWFAFSEVRELMGDRIIVPGMNAASPINDSPLVQTQEQREPFEKLADKAAVMEQDYERSNFQRMMRSRR